MYIIDKNRDYYDYFRNIYGIDKTITYDRRGSTVLSELSLIEYISPFERDKLKSTQFFILEVGNVQYLFRVKIQCKLEGINKISVPVKGDFNIIKIFTDYKHYFDKEISIVPADIPFMWKRHEDEYEDIRNFSDLHVYKDKVLSNPILKDTSIASLISPKDIWIELSNFISSKYNDKTLAIVNTDVDKLINHGFDKKTSFRNPIREKFI